MAISILIVDDHSMLRRLLKRHLEMQEDFTVVGEAEDALEGIAKAESLLPDLVIMDVSMPGMDGIEATRTIRERLPQVKVLMLTLYASNENCARAMSSGASGYLLKDSVDDEIEMAVRSVMEGSTYFGAGVADPLGQG